MKNIYINLKSKLFCIKYNLIGNKIIKTKIIGLISKLKNVEFYNSVLSGNLQFGYCVKIYHSHLYGNIEIGNYTSIWGPNTDLYSGKRNIIIGKFCSIARNVSIQCYNHNMNKITTYYIGANLFNEEWENENLYKGDIIIKNDVWIGSHSIIMPGVTIGNGAIIAANSVVTKNVPDYTVVAGSPARVIKKRFEEPIIEKLLKIKWWDWSYEKIVSNRNLFLNEITLNQLDPFK